MKYRILDLKNYESIVDEYLEDFADEFDYDSSKEMVKERKNNLLSLLNQSLSMKWKTNLMKIQKF